MTVASQVFDQQKAAQKPVTDEKEPLYEQIGRLQMDRGAGAIELQSESSYRSLAGELEQRVVERTQQLRRANQELTRSNDNLQQFAYVVSHDLQEPLRKVQQFGNLLKNQYADQLGPGVDYLHRMQSAASRMSTLINDLLSYSRIVTQPETATPVDLNQVLDGVLSDLELRIAETGARIERDALPIVTGDSSQLGPLFFNLLANALKFHRRGEKGAVIPPQISVGTNPVAAVSLPASVRPTRAGEWYYQIEVADNGIGFDEQYVERIVEVFHQLPGRSEFRGTGIGLAIWEKVVANHGGAIGARSQPGQGATFSIYLPVK